MECLRIQFVQGEYGYLAVPNIAHRSPFDSREKLRLCIVIRFCSLMFLQPTLNDSQILSYIRTAWRESSLSVTQFSFLLQFWVKSQNTRISEAVVRRSTVDHSPGPVRLPAYKCCSSGPFTSENFSTLAGESNTSSSAARVYCKITSLGRERSKTQSDPCTSVPCRRELIGAGPRAAI